MTEALSGLFGVIVGSLLAWRLARRDAHLDRLQKAIEATCLALQRYRIAYAQYFTEYLSESATEAKQPWPPPVAARADRDYLELERLVDEHRGELRVQQAILCHLLKPAPGKRASDALDAVLYQTAPQVRANSSVADAICEKAMDQLISLMPRG